jgi:hypothetical protein
MVGVSNASNRSKGAGQLMIAIVLIAIAAGCASALMFASLVSGALISLLLFNLAPLPLMVAALGWGPLCVSIGGIGAATVLGAIFGLRFCIAFAITVAVPAWWLGHLALLARPARTNAASIPGAPAADLEWYPIGRILLWTASFATLATMAALLTFGSDVATITGALRSELAQMISLRHGAVLSEQSINAVVTLAAAAAAMAPMMILILNLWLAGRAAAISGRLHRRWPDMKTVALPPMTLVAVCIAIALSFWGDLLGILAQIVTANLMLAYALTGLAVLHTLTLPLRRRAFWLGLTYAIMVLFVWPLLVMVVVGLAEAIFGFRQRYWQGRPPPLPAS